MQRLGNLDVLTAPAVAEPRAADQRLPPVVAAARLGEELPIFCERCGYALHGLPPVRCAHCEVLHFRCPECGHSQPINTLRPAVQRMLGRLRAWLIGLWVFIKLNIVFWVLFGWVAMGVEWSYEYRQTFFPAPPAVAAAGMPGVMVTRPPPARQWVYQPRSVDLESILAFGIFALATGLVLRMFLLRWRRGYLVGAVLAALVVGAIFCGAWLQSCDRAVQGGFLTRDMMWLAALSACCVTLGAAVVFWIWSGLVRLFLPTRAAKALLDWQQAPSDKVADLARQ